MNRVKHILSALVAVLALGSSAEVHAKSKPSQTLPAYERKVSAVDIQDKENGNSTIQLDDGSAWEIVGYLLGNEKDARMWKAGDEVDFYWSPPKSRGIFCLNNRQRDGQPIVLLKSETMKSFPTISEVLNDGEYIKLSDGSLWEFSWWGKTSTKHWKDGHHIIVQGNGKKNNYSLANLNLSDDSLINIKFAHAKFIKYEK